MSTVIVIGGGHADYRHFTLAELQESNYKILLIDDEVSDTSLVNYEYIVNFDQSAKKQAQNFKLELGTLTQGRLHGVCYIESLLEWASDFFGELEIDFIEPAVAKRVRSKYLMRTAFQDGGITVPKYALYKKSDLRKNSELFNYPFIIKPECGYSSIGVTIIKSREDLYTYLNLDNNVISDDYIVEDYVLGKEYSIEGYVNENEGCLPLYKTIKFKTKLPFFEELGQYTDRSLIISGNEACFFERCVNALGIKNSIIHLEIIDNDFELVPVELGARLAGDKIPYLHRKIHGESLVTKFLGSKCEFPKISEYGIGIVFFIPSEEGEIAKDFSFSSSIVEVLEIKFDIRHTTIKTAPDDYFVRLGFAIISSSSKLDFIDKANRVIDEFECASGLHLFKVDK